MQDLRPGMTLVRDYGSSPAGPLLLLVSMRADTRGKLGWAGLQHCQPACKLGLGEGQAKPATASTSACKSQVKCQLTRLCHSIHEQVLEQGTSCVRLDHSTPRKLQNPGLEVGLVGRLQALLYLTEAPAGE